LEACLASLDGAKYGLCFASGLGAATAIVHLLNSGDHIVSVDDLYGGTYRYFNKVRIYGSSLISKISAGIILWKDRSYIVLFVLFYIFFRLFNSVLFTLYKELFKNLSERFLHSSDVKIYVSRIITFHSQLTDVVHV
jgi:hypothetical protein